MLAVARTFALLGVDAAFVDAEVDIHRGLPAFSIVGLPDAAVRESRERVRAAIVNSGFEFPLKRITVSLAPSDLRKAGPGFDLAIAAALLAASGQLRPRLLERWALAGELALDGRLRPVRGALAMTDAARSGGEEGIAVPLANAAEAAMVSGITVAPVASLRSLLELDRGKVGELPDQGGGGDEGANGAAAPAPDLRDLRGQPLLRRGLEVAAAGGHSMLIVGPPGAGKSMAARRLPSILPPLRAEEAIEVIRIAGVAGLDVGPPDAVRRPFRAPHHTISAAGLVGGGSPPRPGEISLAHRGVLFLDELGEFGRASLEALRQPLECGEVTIARARGRLRFPAEFQLVAAANPCPCGHGEGDERCACSPQAAQRYRARLSGALADRIDINLSVAQPEPGSLAGDEPESSSTVRERVAAARAMQQERLGRVRTNGAAADIEPRDGVGLSAPARRALERAQRRHGLSGRGWNRALRLARTHADLDGCGRVEEEHVLAALAMRGRAGAG
jgi:magnesium chelatase family protein